MSHRFVSFGFDEKLELITKYHQDYLYLKKERLVQLIQEMICELENFKNEVTK